MPSNEAPTSFTGRSAPADPKPMSLDEFKQALVDQSTSRPQVLNEQEYRALLDKSVVSGFQKGSAMLDQVRATLHQLASQQGPQAATLGDTPAAQPGDLNLALQKLDQAESAFQYAAAWHCLGCDGGGDGLQQVSPVIVHSEPSGGGS